MNKTEQINTDGKLTRQHLKQPETKEMTPLQKFFELVIMVLPLVCGIIAILEYKLLPDNSMNNKPNTYLWVLIGLVVAYNVYGWFAGYKRVKGDKSVYEKLRFRAPLFSALFLLLAVYDYMTLKTEP